MLDILVASSHTQSMTLNDAMDDAADEDMCDPVARAVQEEDT